MYDVTADSCDCCVTGSTASNRFVSRQNSTQNWKEIPEGNTATRLHWKYRINSGIYHLTREWSRSLQLSSQLLSSNFLEVLYLYSIISVTYNTAIIVYIVPFVLVEAYAHGQEWSSCLPALSQFLNASKTCTSTFDRTRFDPHNRVE